MEANTPGVRLTVGGYVFGLACRPISGVLLDFWQADTNGAYDNTGFRFRGHQFTGADGSFKLTTIVPGLYPGRTRHLHVKVQAPAARSSPRSSTSRTSPATTPTASSTHGCS